MKNETPLTITIQYRKHWLFYSVESKLVLILKYNKTIDKVFGENNINNHK
jgi:hypothetical protein